MRSVDKDNITQAFDYIAGIFSTSLFEVPQFEKLMLFKVLLTGALLVFFLLVEWLGRENEYAIEGVSIRLNKKVFRWSFYVVLWSFVFIYSDSKQEFIYFQF